MQLPSVRPLTAFLTSRRLARSPIPLFRGGLGVLLGPRMLLLEHVGRTSGKPRFVALEVAKRESRNSLVIASGFGERAQWYRNLEANQHCHVWNGLRRRVPAVADLLTEVESRALLTEYAAAHPRLYRSLMLSIADISGHRIEDVPAGIRMVRLKLGDDE